VPGDLSSIDDDLDVLGIGKNGSRPVGVVGGNRITVRVELDEGGLSYRYLNNPVWSVRNGRQGKKRFFCQSGCRYHMGCAVDTFIPLFSPPVGLSVQVTDIGKFMGPEEVSDISYGPFHTTFLIAFARVTGMNGDVQVACEVDELRVQYELGPSLCDHAFEVVISILPGRPLDLPVGFKVTVSEELQGRAGIEPDEEVSGPGQDEDEAVNLAEGHIRLHPIDLRTFPRQELELVIHGFALLP
jgi:hypothetical protein